jgi:hypothetical protein
LPFAQQACEGARRKRIEPVADDAQHHERQAEHDDLAPDRAVGVDELRQEREEEERGLRVEHVHNRPLREQAAKRLRARERSGRRFARE